jgi:NADH-quinone oxidoreductase subunit A
LEGADQLNPWIFVGVFLLVAAAVPSAALLVAKYLGPRKPAPIKSETYECGVETYGPTWVQFKAQYYVYALVFVVFDVELVFLFPWAMVYGHLPLFVALEGALFLLILAGGLVYIWRKGALEWE